MTSPASRFVASCLLLGALACAPPAAAHAVRQHGPHVHGEATLDIAVDGRTLALELDAPGDSLLGFEHVPRTKAERERLAATIDLLRTPGRWLIPNARAACTLSSATATPRGYGQQAGADGHAEFEARYRYDCARPADLDALQHTMFATFPRLHRLNVNLALPTRQDRMQLAPGQTRILLGR